MTKDIILYEGVTVSRCGYCMMYARSNVIAYSTHTAPTKIQYTNKNALNSPTLQWLVDVYSYITIV